MLAKSGWNWPRDSWEVENVESLKMTDKLQSENFLIAVQLI